MIKNQQIAAESHTVERLLLGDLLEKQIKELGLRKAQVVEHWGYQNTGKGLRRLEQIVAGCFTPSSPDSLLRLAAAISVDEVVLKSAFAATHEKVEQDRQDARHRDDQAWCDQFVPHAILITRNKVPSQIFVAALVGVDRLLRRDFDHTQSKSTWIGQVLEKLPKGVIAFGEVLGFWINHTPYHAVEHDLAGQPIAERQEAYRPGRASLFIKKAELT